MHADVDTLIELLAMRAADDPELRLLTFLERGEEESRTLTAGGMETRARALGARLVALVDPCARALLFFGPGLDFTVGYWGCLYAGVIAVPIPSPSVRAIEAGPRLRSVRDDCDATVMLTTSDLLPQVEEMTREDPELARLHVVAVDRLAEESSPGWTPPPIEPGTVAHLQYSSGSTGTPKGVMLTHANILANLRMIRGDSVRDGDRGVTWLPMFHDMGLLLGMFLPVYSGGPAWVMSPLAFLQQPRRWLEAISVLGATASATPNFALDLAVERIDEAQRETLDLSSLEVLSVGSDPIRRESLHRFAEAFAPCGFDPHAFFPSYGLAEATLMVSGGPLGSGMTELTVDADELAGDRAVPAGDGTPRTRTLVASGEAPPDVLILVVDPETLAPLDDGGVGEILVASPSVGAGYWRNPAESEAAFGVRLSGRDESFMRTGDLGFLHHGQLFVTGRLKEVVIVAGQNHYPQDIELTAGESHPGLRRDRCVAFSVDDGTSERVIIVAEVDRRALNRAGGRERDVRPEVIDAITRDVAAVHGIRVDEVALVRRVPLTSSGKLRRGECRDLFLADSLDSATVKAAAPA
jgi:acyl-CoA synthetase (AMP-forming)/AMP-acid ligase II